MKKKHSIFIDFFIQTFLLIIGGVLCAFAVKGILIPHDFISSGFTGFSLILYYLFPFISLGMIYFYINVPIFFLGWYYIGLRFVAYSFWGILIYSLLLYYIDVKLIIQDKFLAAFIAGIISGIGTGIMLSSKGSSGGSEIVCAIFNKFFSLTIGSGQIIINALVMIAAACFFPLENVLYTLIYIVVSAKATDMVFHGMNIRKTVFIISDKWDQILEDLTKKLDIGITIIEGRGGYEGLDKKILFSVINRSKIYRLKKIVISRDENAFISIMEASDVTGLNIGNQPDW